MFKVQPKETVSLISRDGVRLDADLYRPEGQGKFPVLLMRQPYGRAIASTVVYAHPLWYASHGYIVVIQDVRGRGTSEGEFDLFAHEIEDGEDTVNWAAQLPGSTGQVGMYGFSYQGMTQLYAAINQPTALKVLCPSMLAHDLYTDWAYENEAFCLQANLGWAVQLAAETARLQGDTEAFEVLYDASRHLPFQNPSPQFTASFKQYDPYYFQWLNHPHPGKYWEKLSPKSWLYKVDLPMLHIGGWFDPYLRGTLNLYQEMTQRSMYPQHLIIGAWGHLPWGKKVGSLDYGNTAVSPVDELQIRWFDRFLKGKETGLKEEPSVMLFEMGRNQWRYFDHFPQHQQQCYFLSSDGLGSIREDRGKLELKPPSDHNSSSIPDVLVHDPWRPVPALGGHSGVPPGSFERSHLDCRTDILTYTSAPLDADLSIVGVVTVQLYCQADTSSFDLCAVLSEVLPNGKVYNFTQGYRRVNEETNVISIPLQATCMTVMKGHCLRLSLSAACFPAYAINPGTGSYSDNPSCLEAKIITVMVKNGTEYPSTICLPILVPLRGSEK